MYHSGHDDPICALALSHSDQPPLGHSDLSVGRQPNLKDHLLHTKTWTKNSKLTKGWYFKIFHAITYYYECHISLYQN